MVISSSAELSVDYLDNVTVSCIAMSLINVTITWSTTANVTLPNTTTETLSDGQYESLLALTSVGLEAAGVYTCTAQGSSGSDVAKITVNVEGL